MTAPRPMRFDVSTDRGLETFLEVRNGLLLSGKDAVFQLLPPKRTKSQNDLSFALYTQIARQKQDESVEDIRRQCKLEYGVPILRRDDEEFRYVYDNSTKKLEYEAKLISMKWTDVTSRMSKKQFSEYVDTVIREYSKQGIVILMPGE